MDLLFLPFFFNDYFKSNILRFHSLWVNHSRLYIIHYWFIMPCELNWSTYLMKPLSSNSFQHIIEYKLYSLYILHNENFFYFLKSTDKYLTLHWFDNWQSDKRSIHTAFIFYFWHFQYLIALVGLIIKINDCFGSKK